MTPELSLDILNRNKQMAKRKITATGDAGHRAKRTRPTEAFVWKLRAWNLKQSITDKVSLMASRTEAKVFVVKKVIETHQDVHPPEIAILALLPDCNRVVKPIFYSHADPDPQHGTAIFQHYPMKDIQQWKEQEFDMKNQKPISRYGTFRWQPPENTTEGINTEAADVWALGACVHFLATGKAPVTIEESRAFADAQYRANNGQHPASVQEFNLVAWYYDAHAPRRIIPINLTKDEHHQRGLGLSIEEKRSQAIGPEYYQYSDELNDWMMQCLNFRPSERPNTSQLTHGMGIQAVDMLRKMGGKSALVDMEAKFGVGTQDDWRAQS
ncbi:serine threonine kinase [Pyrenophora seminiperda CCB06]|uniref:Serine threonine kinase n=1 Tax=Pyrenophora seminiperda CCB06 TaxID=1302712 RepID=A0A3M7M6S3_9PLEO|nr:serine threonine kinase [Pyrenophora seminiperda CCB06]